MLDAVIRFSGRLAQRHRCTEANRAYDTVHKANIEIEIIFISLFWCVLVCHSIRESSKQSLWHCGEHFIWRFKRLPCGWVALHPSARYTASNQWLCVKVVFLFWVIYHLDHKPMVIWKFHNWNIQFDLIILLIIIMTAMITNISVSSWLYNSHTRRLAISVQHSEWILPVECHSFVLFPKSNCILRCVSVGVCHRFRLLRARNVFYEFNIESHNVDIKFANFISFPARHFYRRKSLIARMGKQQFCVNKNECRIDTRGKTIETKIM